MWHLAGPRRGGVPDLALRRKKIFFYFSENFSAGAHNWTRAGAGSNTENQRLSSNQDFRIEFRY